LKGKTTVNARAMQTYESVLRSEIQSLMYRGQKILRVTRSRTGHNSTLYARPDDGLPRNGHV